MFGKSPEIKCGRLKRRLRWAFCQIDKSHWDGLLAERSDRKGNTHARHSHEC
jgi:hypothetical protein